MFQYEIKTKKMHLRYRSFEQECHNWIFVIFQEKSLKVLKCYNFLWFQRRHNCSPAASFANCVMTLYLLKVGNNRFFFYTNNSKMPNFELWHSCRKWGMCEFIIYVEHLLQVSVTFCDNLQERVVRRICYKDLTDNV
jgi:hypothetical protein